jgi:hypothetical protein
MSQKSGHAIPPFTRPQKKNPNAAITIGGKNATAVCVGALNSEY